MRTWPVRLDFCYRSLTEVCIICSAKWYFSSILYYFFFLPLYQFYAAFIGIPSPCLQCFQTPAHPWPLLIGSSFYVCALSVTISTEQNAGVGFLTGSDSERGF